MIDRFNDLMEAACLNIQKDPEIAIISTGDEIKFPAPILRNALKRTRFRFLKDKALKHEILFYCQMIGKPFDEPLDSFF